MSDFDIRSVTPGDISDLVTMSDALGAFHNDDTQADPAALARDLFGSQPWLWGLIARDGHRSIGYALMLPTAQVQHGRRGLDLHHMYVDAAFRGQGLGRAMLREVEAKARALDCTYVIIGTDPNNTGAQTAYQAMGYTERNPGPRFAKRVD